tara:strand:+ start:23284 stop:24240 length:957 start_codon:yes stop_codon:yes gene_type:complete
MQASDNSQLNLDYAQEWISDLKRRNLLLTIVWPTLLVLSILAALFAFYFYQLEQTSTLGLAIETEKNHSLDEKNQSLQSEISALTSTNSKLETELADLINAREKLSVLNDDSTSKLNITSQMVDNLNQLVAELKNEREDLSGKLEDSLETIAQLRNQHEQFIKQATKDKTDAVAQLNQQIKSRTTAYQALANRQQEMRDEMDKLNDLANSKDKQIEKLKKDNSSLSTQLTEKSKEIGSYKNRINVLENSYSELESKLNAIVSPIVSPIGTANIGTTNPIKHNTDNTNAQQTEASRKITGLEEIKKPAVQNKTNNKNQD